MTAPGRRWLLPLPWITREALSGKAGIGPPGQLKDQWKELNVS